MDPTEILNVCFHYGGGFIRIGNNLRYVGGDDALSEIKRDKLPLQDLKGFAKDHLPLNNSMKFYFLLPGKELVDGLLFLNDDTCCLKMADYTCVGGLLMFTSSTMVRKTLMRAVEEVILRIRYGNCLMEMKKKSLITSRKRLTDRCFISGAHYSICSTSIY
jgi:hypothetical protein